MKSLSLTCIWVDTRSSGTASISHAPEKVVLGRTWMWNKQPGRGNRPSFTVAT